MMTRLAALVVALAALVTAQAPQADADAARLLAIASSWAVRFELGLSGLLFRERYTQSVTQGSGGAVLSRDRSLESNVFLLKPASQPQFVLFRDVYRANGKEVGDHTERLATLLTSGASGAMTEARRLTDASARYNISSLAGNVNIPTMPFGYLAPKIISSLNARITGTEKVGGLKTTVLEFDEVGSPTLVRGPGGDDLPAKGRYWIDPASGAVVRAEVQLAANRMSGKVRVDLELHKTLGAWVPRVMNDSWNGDGQRVVGRADYDNFKRLAVATTEIIK